MNKLFTLFLFLFYFENNVIFAKYYYVKLTDKEVTDCSQRNPCHTLSEALKKVNNYDTIYVDGDIDEESKKVEIDKTVTIRSLTEGKKVTIPVSHHEDPDGYRFHSYICNGYCIMKDFKFVLASEEDKAPDDYVFYAGRYLCLESVDFVRENIEGKTPVPLGGSLLSGSRGDSTVSLYLHSCTFTDIELKEHSLIEQVNVAMYNCQFKNINNLGGYGSVINGGEYYLDIVDTTFDSCNTHSDKGGALYLKPDSYLLIGGYKSKTVFKNCRAHYDYSSSKKNQGTDIPNSYGGAIFCRMYGGNYNLNLTGIEFGTDENANFAKYGANFFIYAGFCFDGLNETSFPHMKNDGESTDNYACCFDFYDNLFYPMKCLFEHNCEDYPHEVYVGGKEDSDCLSSDKPCSSLLVATDLIKYGTINVSFVGYYYMLREVYFYLPSYLKSFINEAKIYVDYGYFYFTSNSTLENLVFYLPSSFTKSYLIYSSKSKIILKSLLFSVQEGVSKCEFQHCLLMLTGDVELDNCNFSNIKQVGQRKNYFNYINYHGVTINNCNFDTCSAVHKGGGLCLDAYTSSDYSSSERFVNITSSSFKRCTSGYGGALFLSYSVPGRLNLDGITFGTDSEKNTAYYGCNLYFYSSSIGDVVTTTNFKILEGVTLDSSIVDNEPLYACSTSFTDFNPVGFINYNMIGISSGLLFTDKVFVGDGGDDTKSCKDKNNLCKTINYAFDVYPFNNTEITVVQELTIDDSLYFSLNEHPFHGENSNTKLIASEDAMLGLYDGTMKDFNIFISKSFDSSMGYFMIVFDVSLFNIKFTAESKLENCNKIIFSSYGYLKLQDCSFTNITSTSTVIISGLELSIELKDCSFVNITNEGNKSPCIDGDVHDSIINSTTFEGCVTKNEYGAGGGLNINIYGNCYIGGSGTKTVFKKCSAWGGGGILVQSQRSVPFVFADLTFGSGNDENNATYGKNILFYSECVDSVADLEHFPTLKGESESDNNLYVFPTSISESKMTTESLIKLINGKLKEGANALYIGDDGDNGKDCSSAEKGKLCSNMDDVRDKVKFDIYNISIVKQFTLSESLHNGYRYALKGNEIDSKILTRSYSIEINYYACFTSLIFLIGDTEAGESSGSSSSSEDYYGHYVFSAESGSLILSSSTVQSENKISYLNGAIIHIEEYANCFIEDCIIKDAELFSYSSSPLVGGALFAYASECNEIKIRGVTFSNLKVYNGLGGGIYANVDNGSTFVIESNGDKKTTFKNCTLCELYYEYKIIWYKEANDQHGRGGAIYMNVESHPKKLYVSCEFGTEGEKNEAIEGYDIYVRADDMKRIMNFNNFPCLKDKGEGYDGAMGYDESAPANESGAITDLAQYAKDNKFKESEGGDGFPTWAIVLIVVLVIVVIAVIVIVIVVVVIVMKKKKGGDDDKKEEMGTDNKEEAANSE